MSNFRKLLATTACALALPLATPLIATPAAGAAPGGAHPVSAAAADGTRLEGEIDFPQGSDRHSVVLLVPGTGGFNRDAWFGKSGTPDDLIFARLTRALNAAGFAVIRYDERGRTCHTGDKPDQRGVCSDAHLVATISAGNKVSDLVALASAALADPVLDGHCLTVFAHSEGALTAAHAIETKQLHPAALIGMGAPMDAPAALIRWQMVDRSLATFRAMDSDHDGFVSRDEIVKGWRAQGLSEPVIAAAAQKLAERRSLGEIEKRLTDAYGQARADALAHPAADPYPSAAMPVADYSWWRQWFEDWRPVASRLADFTGPVTLLYGSIDAQVPPDRDIAAAREWLPADTLHVSILPARGHTLGVDPILGPTSDDGLKAIVDAAVAAAAACRGQAG